MQTRPFGRTGEAFPILSFGAQRIVDGHGCTEAEAIRMINYAIDHGIRYFDTAFVYSDGQSEERLGKVVKTRRNEMWIATKAWDRTAGGARRQLETSLRRLQTDHVDEWRMHNIATFAELDQITGPGGALEAAAKAQEESKVRYISFSGHTNPQVQLEGLRRFPFASALIAVSVIDHFFSSFAEEFVPVANQQGVATIGMKLLALSKLAPYYDRALRFAFSQPLSTFIVGMESMEQLKKNLAVAESFTPLSDEERLELFREVMPLVRPDVMPWKADDWGRPAAWYRREPLPAR